MDWDGYIQVWSEAHIKVLEARQKAVEQGESMAVYRLPASAYTRVVSTMNGDVEIPAHPKRVASDQYMGQLLKLGIVPVGARSFMLTENWIDKAGLTDTVKGMQILVVFQWIWRSLLS